MTNIATRRTIIAGLAAAPVAGLAAAQEADPIFTAIERHREAFRAFEAASNLADEARAEQKASEVTDAEEAACLAALDMEKAALHDLIQTQPTTKAGARAALSYLVELDRGCIPLDSGRFAATLLKSSVLWES